PLSSPWPAPCPAGIDYGRRLRLAPRFSMSSLEELMKHQPSSITFARPLGLILAAMLVAACSDDPGGGHDTEKVAPACELAPNSKALFTPPIVPLESVTRSLIMGELSPEVFEEGIPNFEMGFGFA